MINFICEKCKHSKFTDKFAFVCVKYKEPSGKSKSINLKTKDKPDWCIGGFESKEVAKV